mmetsp:Transcript_10020/g.28473  ORF Transcript_10020/g.28473 Transcript_10020/m.28473 type:complete len:218 (-) Transcript_10020:681-1334(-)
MRSTKRSLILAAAASSAPPSPRRRLTIFSFRSAISSCIRLVGPKRRPSLRAMSTSIICPLSQTLSSKVRSNFERRSSVVSGQPLHEHCATTPWPGCHRDHHGIERPPSTRHMLSASHIFGQPYTTPGAPSVRFIAQQPEEASGQRPSSQMWELTAGGLQEVKLRHGDLPPRHCSVHSRLGVASADSHIRWQRWMQVCASWVPHCASVKQATSQTPPP